MAFSRFLCTKVGRAHQVAQLPALEGGCRFSQDHPADVPTRNDPRGESVPGSLSFPPIPQVPVLEELVAQEVPTPESQRSPPHIHPSPVTCILAESMASASLSSKHSLNSP